jgi:hypothetical protein
LNEVTAIAAGSEFSVALKRDGTVVAWGRAGSRVVPTGLNGVVAISALGTLNGGQFALALKSDGKVVGWGANGEGQLNVPPNLENVVAIAAGGFHGLALKSDGTIVSWGSATGRKTITPPGLPRSVAIAASQQSSFALTGTSFQVLQQPEAQSILAGQSAVLRVEAQAASPVAYQWRKDNVNIPGATASTLTLPAAGVADAGNYDVVFTVAGANFPSAGARLIVTTGNEVEVSRIANLSIRTSAGTGASTLIVGFAIGGPNTTGTKPLLVRGVGPTLSTFGVTGALTDPKLELYGTNAVKLFDNDNWNASDAATFATAGAFPLVNGSRDAALYNNAMVSGSYSAQLSGVGTSNGIVLAEIYDVSPSATFTGSTPRLVNVSARTLSGAGADVLIAGFVIAGPTPKTVIIRGIGPTLGIFGVTGVLTDPKLELFDSATVKIQENDNWGGTAALADAFDAVGAFRLDPASRDAALLATLPPGSYTVQVTGVGGALGVALVEIYDVL